MCKDGPKELWLCGDLSEISGQGYEWSEISVVRLLARCAEHKFLIFAEEILMYARKSNVPLLIIVYGSDLVPSERGGKKKQQFKRIQTYSNHAFWLIGRQVLSWLGYLRQWELQAITLSIYSALMKVYAFSGLYERACDLYEDIQKDGIEPDSIMHLGGFRGSNCNQLCCLQGNLCENETL